MQTEVVNEENNSQIILPRRSRRSVWGYLALCYTFFVCFWIASVVVSVMDSLVLGVAVLVLSGPSMIALWHQGTVRRLARLHQFQAGRALHRWESMRTVGVLLRAAFAVSLTAIVVVQSILFSQLEWLLLLASPLIYLTVRSVIEKKTTQQFSARVYAQRWSLWITECLVVFVLSVTWVYVIWESGEPVAGGYAEQVYALQSGWVDSSSSVVKAILDFSAWGKAAFDVANGELERGIWQLPVFLFAVPLSIFGYTTLTLSGFSLSVLEVRRTLGAHLTADDVPPAVGGGRAAVWAAVGVVGVLVFFQLLAVVDYQLARAGNAFALTALPECERIGGKVYKVGTLETLQARVVESERAIESVQGEVCSKLTSSVTAVEQVVDQYLDWYFSLGADWMRTLAMLQGDGAVDRLLAGKFNEVVTPAYIPVLEQISIDYEKQSSHVFSGRASLQDVLEKNRLIMTDDQCKVVADEAIDPMLASFDSHKARLVAGSGSGLVAGTFAAKVVAKAMSKASMKSAGKVLVKATAKKIVGKAGGAAAGAVAGSVVPGAGTVVGALIGAAVGLIVGTSIDIGALAAEEKLNREDMKKDLLAAVTESLEPHRKAFACQ